MNHWHNEFMAEYQRQRILEEGKQIHLEKVINHPLAYRSSLFGRTMFNLANWMISTGSQLRRRYEVPVTHCNQPPTGSLAR
ncbi:MAG: hypothetical protein ACM3PS_08540 [Syntrophothermus sp.]|jgi:hypothetical protein